MNAMDTMSQKDSYCCLVTKLCSTLVTPWTVARLALLSMGFPRQEYWSGLPFTFLRIHTIVA